MKAVRRQIYGYLPTPSHRTLAPCDCKIED